ncbi:50S ribosomal protein L3 [Candidatus Micrarchaeota archaeon CG_4_10_14_0_2_um_filter_55_9]|nr:MAG: 50S ribosomal protein L3 [Candidatus Micrarchaeota archaeon CG1_02_55_41]PIO02577.1 MAG: 50S ribosomal protein L3 [Candidatus Micrarchaeota archaeon CG09_land_8_20_14_0_10_55_25]PIZ91971.1 MAG: 50S ribosomal protein L3 [Candidatus Micrarchaeota archaeon CG_4_10_14_0_2_um_filter_55_9]PJD01030.1 MAG: 50S ribosomal protein L3 [Candidatus Micrarchaeota archaeon CG10_big_fil_rev_8_21_14_0_10_54_18]
MGTKRHGPKRGSRAFWHRKRAKRTIPRLNTWPNAGKGLQAFPGYKVGMSMVSLVSESESAFKGQEVARAITLVETPPVFVYSIVFYERDDYGLKPAGEVVAIELSKDLRKHFKGAKKANKKIEDFPEPADVRLHVLAQPFKAGLPMKRAQLVEIGLGGSIQEKIEYAKGVLGKEVAVNDVVQEGGFLDVTAVTKGHGWTGIVKRFGVSLNIRKATQKRRHGGSIGPERQAKVMYTIPRAGQYGYHRRTEQLKRALRIGSEPTIAFKNYGHPKTAYVVVEGSVPGPAKRFVLLRKPMSGKKPKPTQIREELFLSGEKQ